jgi:hypothetical protein
MIELTEEQLQALDRDADGQLRLVDPRTQQTYVLLRSEVYEGVLTVLGNEDGLDGLDVGTLIAGAMVEDDENDPLLETYQKEKSPT